MAHDIQETVTRYLAACNETDATRRRVLLATLVGDDCEYIDPLANVSGLSALVSTSTSTSISTFHVA